MIFVGVLLNTHLINEANGNLRISLDVDGVYLISSTVRFSFMTR